MSIVTQTIMRVPTSSSHPVTKSIHHCCTTHCNKILPKVASILTSKPFLEENWPGEAWGGLPYKNNGGCLSYLSEVTNVVLAQSGVVVFGGNLHWYLFGVKRISSHAHKTGSWYLSELPVNISDEHPSPF